LLPPSSWRRPRAKPGDAPNSDILDQVITDHPRRSHFLTVRANVTTSTDDAPVCRSALEAAETVAPVV